MSLCGPFSSGSSKLWAPNGMSAHSLAGLLIRPSRGADLPVMRRITVESFPGVSLDHLIVRYWLDRE